MKSKKENEFINSTSSTELEINGERIIIGSEIMKVRTNDTATATLTVFRGYDQTTATTHEHNTAVNILSTDDDAAIEFGDDFGFNETTSFFQDGKTYSPSQGIDV